MGIASQPLVNEFWPWLRGYFSRAKFHSAVSNVELGDKPVQIHAIRIAEPPVPGIVCFDVDISMCGGQVLPSADIKLKLPGLHPFQIRVSVVRFEATVQGYGWSEIPKGRGNGQPYSLIEGALSPQAPRPPVIHLYISSVNKSKTLSRLLPVLRPIISAVIESSVLPRLTGFKRRIKVQENLPPPTVGDASWEAAARRAGWVSRAEVEIDGALAEVVLRVGDKASSAAGMAAKTLTMISHGLRTTKKVPTTADEEASLP